MLSVAIACCFVSRRDQATLILTVRCMRNMVKGGCCVIEGSGVKVGLGGIGFVALNEPGWDSMMPLGFSTVTREDMR